MFRLNTNVLVVKHPKIDLSDSLNKPAPAGFCISLFSANILTNKLKGIFI